MSVERTDRLWGDGSAEKSAVETVDLLVIQLVDEWVGRMAEQKVVGLVEK